LDTQLFHLQLRGAVEFGRSLENRYSGKGLLGDILGMTNTITNHSRTFLGLEKVFGWKITALWKINLFYLVVFIVGVYYGDAIWRHIKPPDVDPATRGQVIRIAPPEGNSFTIRVEIPEKLQAATKEKVRPAVTAGKKQ